MASVFIEHNANFPLLRVGSDGRLLKRALEYGVKGEGQMHCGRFLLHIICFFSKSDNSCKHNFSATSFTL